MQIGYVPRAFLPSRPERPVWRDMPIECLRRDPWFFAEGAYVSRLPMLAMASRSFAAVIFGLRPPTRPRIRAEARPARVRSVMSWRSS
jgi:hypothetical protein